MFGWDDKENDDDDDDDYDDDDDDDDVWMWTECLVREESQWSELCFTMCGFGTRGVKCSNKGGTQGVQCNSTGQYAYFSSNVWYDIAFFVDGQKIAPPCGWL